MVEEPQTVPTGRKSGEELSRAQLSACRATGAVAVAVFLSFSFCRTVVTVLSLCNATRIDTIRTLKSSLKTLVIPYCVVFLVIHDVIAICEFHHNCNLCLVAELRLAETS